MQNTTTKPQTIPQDALKITVLYADKTKEQIDAIFKEIGYTGPLNFGRKGWTLLQSPDLPDLVVFKAKGPESTDFLASVSDMVITGTDIGRKLQNLEGAKVPNLQKVGMKCGKEVWGNETWLGVLIPKELVSDPEFDIETEFFTTIVTKYGPILTKKVLSDLGLNPNIEEVDSNSELGAQILKLQKKTRTGIVEIVQSGASVIATQNYVIMPFGEGKVGIFDVTNPNETDQGKKYRLVKEIPQKSPIGEFAKRIYTQINLGLYDTNFEIEGERLSNKARVLALLKTQFQKGG